MAHRSSGRGRPEAPLGRGLFDAGHDYIIEPASVFREEVMRVP